MKKKGLSNVLTAILIVLISILAIIIAWFLVRQTLQEKSENIKLEHKCILTTVEITECRYGMLKKGNENIYYVSGLIKLKQGDPSNLLVAFVDENGNAKTRLLNPIKILETKEILPVTAMNNKPVKAIVTPIISNDEKNKNYTCPVMSEINCFKDPGKGDLCGAPTFIEDIDPFTASFDSNANEELKRCGDFSCDGKTDFNDIDKFNHVIINWPLCNREKICGTDHYPCWDNSENNWCDQNCWPQN